MSEDRVAQPAGDAGVKNSAPRWQEADRLAALAGYDILDTPLERDFDDIIRIAAQVCGAPVSVINLIAEDRQWFKAEIGLGVRETPLDVSICAHAILQRGLFVIPDTMEDARFSCNPLVTGAPHLRFYAGAVLETPEGLPLGTLCVLDYTPRGLSDEQAFTLQALARQVMTQLELRRALKQKLRDVSERREKDRALRETGERLALMVESATDYAIISIDAHKCITGWNPGAERMFRFREEEVVGQPIAVIFTPEDRANGVPEKELSIAAGVGRAEDERWHLREDGTRFFASGIMVCMRDEHGELVGYTKIARDRTQQKEAEEKLILARNLAESANLAKTEFLANMSHEIRTPMNAVIGLANILAMSQPLTDKQKEFIRTLQLSADSLLSLINDLLDISKIEARTVELEKIPFCLSQMMQEIISMMAVRVREKGLNFTLEGECVRRRLFVGDPGRIRQIVLNLCSNAIKFTESGGIHVAITCTPSHLLGIENICIAVRDSGIGIAGDKLESIFQKFVQADSSISRRYGGTGLGLAITKTLTELMGGTIQVESTPGAGSVFMVCLPMERGEDQATAEEAQSDLAPPDRLHAPVPLYRILLVEDYAPNVMVAGAFLEQFGYGYDVAGNGMEAIEKAKEGVYLAVLMDVQMHGMNGFEATRHIREYEKQLGLTPLTIIGMTAHALAGDRDRCLGVGMNDYISKPFNPDELRAKLQALQTLREFA